MKLLTSGSLLLLATSAYASRKAFNPQDPQFQNFLNDDEDEIGGHIPLIQSMSSIMSEFAPGHSDDNLLRHSHEDPFQGLPSGLETTPETDGEPFPFASGEGPNETPKQESKTVVTEDSVENLLNSSSLNHTDPTSLDHHDTEDGNDLWEDRGVFDDSGVFEESETTTTEKSITTTVAAIEAAPVKTSTVTTCEAGFVLKKVGNCETQTTTANKKSESESSGDSEDSFTEESLLDDEDQEHVGSGVEAALYSTGLADQVIFKNDFENFNYKAKKAESEACVEKCVDIDECQNNDDADAPVCQNDQICHNTQGSYGCCNLGYEYRIDELGSEYGCFDKNECDLVDAVCGLDKECFNYEGGHACCGQGYRFSKNSTGSSPVDHCEDIDECIVENLNPCNLRKSPENYMCVNTLGHAKCECALGFELDESDNCRDVNECRGARDVCSADENTMCQNTVGSWKCDCIYGFQRSDDGDCQEQKHCKAGEELDQVSGECVDIDECADDYLHDCTPQQTCVNLFPGFTCECGEGLSYNSMTGACEDINECGLNLHDCDEHGICVNSIGSFQCICNYGYDKCEENPLYRNYEENKCCNINECDNQPCDANAVCKDTIGDFECTCNEGFEMVFDDGLDSFDSLEDYGAESVLGACIDINECEVGYNNTCSVNSRCVNMFGGYECECDAGFAELESLGECSDVDECLMEPCGSGEKCFNTAGSFNCELETTTTEKQTTTTEAPTTTTVKATTTTEAPTTKVTTTEDPTTTSTTAESTTTKSTTTTTEAPSTTTVGPTTEAPTTEAPTTKVTTTEAPTTTSTTTKSIPTRSTTIRSTTTVKAATQGPTTTTEFIPIGTDLEFSGDCDEAGENCDIYEKSGETVLVHDTTTKSHAKDTTKAVVTEATEEYTNVPDEYEYDDVTAEDNTTEENTTEENTTQVITEVWHEDEDVITNFDPCVYNECENEAVCTINHSGEGYSCDCRPNFMGDFCETKMPCADNPCQHDGVCEENYDHISYKCQCPAEHTGFNCELTYKCAENVCNGGTCTEIADFSGFECSDCPQGFEGKFCDNPIPCFSNPCENGSECLNSPDFDDYMCECATQFHSGKNCEKYENPCGDFGDVQILDDQVLDGANHTCTCFANHSGEKCDKCVDNFQGELCNVCIPPLVGDNCDITPPCTKNPCTNHAICTNSDDNLDYECTCSSDDQFFGPNCEHERPCFVNPCKNSAECSDSLEDPTDFVCGCKAGFKGRHCEQVICDEGEFEYTSEETGETVCYDLCEDMNCNHGFCELGMCICDLGWDGLYGSSNCEVCTKDCGKERNGGRCDNDTGECICTEGWTGDGCEVEVITTTPRVTTTTEKVTTTTTEKITTEITTLDTTEPGRTTESFPEENTLATLESTSTIPETVEATTEALPEATPEPTTLEPTTPEPTTLEPTTLEPTTTEPTTPEPTPEATPEATTTPKPTTTTSKPTTTTVTTTTTTTEEPTTEFEPTTQASATGSECDKCEQGCRLDSGVAVCFCYTGYKRGCNDEVCDRDESVALPNFKSRSCPDTVFAQRQRRRKTRKHTISWRKIGDYCYANEPAGATFYHYHKSSGLLFEDAEEFCQDIGANIAFIPTREANFWIGHMFNSEEAYWMGLVSQDRGTTWMWKTGDSYQLSTFSKYSSDYTHQPSSRGNGNLCTIGNGEFDGSWISAGCEDRYLRRVACSKPAL